MIVNRPPTTSCYARSRLEGNSAVHSPHHHLLASRAWTYSAAHSPSCCVRFAGRGCCVRAVAGLIPHSWHFCMSCVGLAMAIARAKDHGVPALGFSWEFILPMTLWRGCSSISRRIDGGIAIMVCCAMKMLSPPGWWLDR